MQRNCLIALVGREVQNCHARAFDGGATLRVNADGCPFAATALVDASWRVTHMKCWGQTL
jgi:hypothetical protein